MAKNVKKMTGEQVATMVQINALGDNGHETALKMQEGGALVCRSKSVPVKHATDEIQAIADQVWALLDRYAYTLAVAEFKPTFNLRFTGELPENDSAKENDDADGAAGNDDDDDPF